MFNLSNKFANFLAVVPVIMLMTLATTLITSVVAGVVFVQLVAVAGWGKEISLAIAILTAVVVYLYIVLQPKIRTYINSRSQ